MPTPTETTAYERNRRELVAYATRLVVRPDVAEEIVQEAALRLLQAGAEGRSETRDRAWLFRVVGNLAIDHLRRHSTWKEGVLLDAKERAGSDDHFVAESRSLRGSPEMRAIAREHLAVCFSCTARNLRPEFAAALLLKEVHSFSVAETAEVLGATLTQVKNWLQSARRDLEARYSTTCALVAKKGVCHQCVELDGFFNGRERNPLEGGPGDLTARLAILRRGKETPLGPWHRRMMRLVDQVLSDEVDEPPVPRRGRGESS